MITGAEYPAAVGFMQQSIRVLFIELVKAVNAPKNELNLIVSNLLTRTNIHIFKNDDNKLSRSNKKSVHCLTLLVLTRLLVFFRRIVQNQQPVIAAAFIGGRIKG